MYIHKDAKTYLHTDKQMHTCKDAKICTDEQT